MSKKVTKYFLLGFVALLFGTGLFLGTTTEVYAANFNFTRSVRAECQTSACLARRSVASIGQTSTQNGCTEWTIGAQMRRHDGTRTAIAWGTSFCSAQARSAFLSHRDNNGRDWWLEAWWH